MIEKSFPGTGRGWKLAGTIKYHHPNVFTMAPPLEPMTFEDVTKVYREEKRYAGITALRPDFYSAVREFIDRLKRDYEKEAAADSYGTKARQLGQQIAKMREKVLQIFDMRADKIMHMAIIGAAGGKTDHSRLTEEETRMLEGSLAYVREMRNSLLDMPRPGNLGFARMSAMPMPVSAEEQKVRVEELVQVKGPEIAPVEAPKDMEARRSTVRPPEQSPPKETAPVEVATPMAGAPKQGKEVILLRILEDIPPFAGPSGTYRLGREDIVTLPPSLGRALVKKGKAVEIVPGRLSEA
jgi:DNA replication factor GINS